MADFEENLTVINMSIKPSERDLAGSGAFSHKICSFSQKWGNFPRPGLD
ncbi:hypothetical protein C943_02467 [Mariniradius saccharolyticus AK6]|uniref:Uncharacterized protein n=1 Tax=Mariniradius saccharolyticus AK6 TaxID=1239962 RepID=M7X1D7_9BACT|nr:hypothetical protein C943_02467 [Mariniradius saccharolyticus AK6]